MAAASQQARELFEIHWTLIRDLIRQVASRQRLGRDKAEDFASYAFLRLIEDDYAVLRRFQGRSRLRTYLTTVVHRLLLDYRIEEWGKWRPSARARQLGEVAVQLERLINRDAHSAEQAADLLLGRLGIESPREELLEIAAQLPFRRRPRLEGEEQLMNLPTERQVEELILDQERARTARKVRNTLQEALAGLTGEDRLILKMRYKDSLTVRQIASELHVADRSLYRRFERCLRILRKHFEQAGLSFSQVATIIGWGLDTQSSYCQGFPLSRRFHSRQEAPAE